MIPHRIQSKEDKTQKFIYEIGKNILEISYIDKGDGKNILCVPTQNGCDQKCLFCCLTGSGIRTKNLSASDMYDAVEDTLDILQLDKEKPLLISFMGAGEPLENIIEVTRAMKSLKAPNTRFALATSLPEDLDGVMIQLGQYVRKELINLKVHLSLHYTEDAQRHRWMPNCGDIKTSINLLEWYRNYTGNKIEIHYTPIKGINDRPEDAVRLLSFLGNRNIPVKLLTFNPVRVGEASNRVRDFSRELTLHGIQNEIYTPPGRDIGASCGQFDLEWYKEKQ